MKKTLIALATLAAAGTAFAQSSATISGSLSVGVMDTGAAGDTAQVAAMGGGTNGININTTEDLGGGIRAGTHFEIRFSPASGDRASLGNGNALFHNANVFVAGGMGTVRLGKISESNLCAFDPWGCAGGGATVAGATGTLGALGSGLVGALAVQNAVSFATPTINGFSASVLTSLSPAAGATSTAAAGSVVTGRTNERRVVSLNYAKGPVALQYLQTNGSGNTAGDYTSVGRTATANTGTAIADNASKATAIGASYNFGVAKLNVTNSVSKGADGAKTFDITTISGSMPMGAYTLLAGYSKGKGTSVTAANDTRMSAGVSYALSKRTTIGADLFKQEGMAAVTGTNATGTAGTGFVLRARHTF